VPPADLRRPSRWKWRGEGTKTPTNDRFLNEIDHFPKTQLEVFFFSNEACGRFLILSKELENSIRRCSSSGSSAMVTGLSFSFFSHGMSCVAFFLISLYCLMSAFTPRRAALRGGSQSANSSPRKYPEVFLNCPLSSAFKLKAPRSGLDMSFPLSVRCAQGSSIES